MLRPWRRAEVGDPELVRTVELEPSHWTVPIFRHGKVLGRIDVAQDGRVMGHAYFYQNPEDLSKCPHFVTRLRDEEAFQQAEKILSTYVDAEFGDPVFVLNGLRNQLAWMIEVRRQCKLVSRVFVTPGYIYQRKIGEKLPPPGWRGGGRLGRR